MYRHNGFNQGLPLFIPLYWTRPHLWRSQTTVTDVYLPHCLHDTFSLVRRYLESWRLPCIIAVRPNKDSITGLSLLAISTTTPISWLHTMLGNGAIMQEYFRYSGLHFTANAWSAVATPHDCPPITLAPANTPAPTPRTQTRILPTTSQSCPLMEPTLYTADLDDDSIPEGDLVLYHCAVVHNYWIRTYWGTPATAGASQYPPLLFLLPCDCEAWALPQTLFTDHRMRQAYGINHEIL